MNESKLVTPARAHLRQAELFIGKENATAAARTAQLILDAVEQLRKFPSSGRPGRLPDTRELAVTRTQFLITYRVRGGTLEILGVLHGAQKWLR